MPRRRAALVVLLAALALGAWPERSDAFWSVFRGIGTNKLERLNKKLAGTVHDFTHNHDADHRFCSKALGEKRDLYVYTPPGYDGQTPFPYLLWLHGFGHDEKNFLDFIVYIDEGIRSGAIPPMVIAAPDSSVQGQASLFNTGSFYLNSKAGRFEDYIVEDVVGFVFKNFALRPERGAHIIGGASMGGYGAYSLAFKHKELFGTVAGIMPPLDMRYVDCKGNYHSNYDPNCVAQRTDFPRNEILARFYGVILVRQRRMLDPLFGRDPDLILKTLSANNPIELLETKSIRPDEFNLFIGYAEKDEFNLDAQAEHFLDVARNKGFEPEVVRIKGGHHNVSTGLKMFPAMAKWLNPLMTPYIPKGYNGSDGATNAVLHAPHRSGVSRPIYLAPLPPAPSILSW